MKDNFCIVPWIHLNPEPSGVVKPCCAYFEEGDYPNLKNMTLEEIWNCDSQKTIRKSFLNNEIPKGCSSCSQREESYNHSLRMAMNDRFGHHIEYAKNNTREDGHFETFQLYYWDFRFSNICNFKCRMCGHGCSSQWYEESFEFFKGFIGNKPKILDKDYYGKDLMTYVDQFIDSVEEIYFAGGEPLLMTEHYRILDMLIEKERFDVFLRYNTNLSTLKYKTYDMIEIWKKFDKVEIFASLDGYGDNAEYSRNGTEWPRVEKNLKALLDSKLEIRISVTVNIFNIFHIPDLLLYLSNMNVNLRTVIPTILSYPSYYRISVLTDDLKKQVKEKFETSIESFPEHQRNRVSELYDGILVVLNQPSNEQDIKQFYNLTNRFDKSRNENIVEVVPEYKTWFAEIKKG